MEPITQIGIPEAREVSTPTRFILYVISVKGPVRSWTVQRRYSEFANLHKKLTELKNLTVQFPPKSLFNFPEFLAERKISLERYLQHILSNTDNIWRRSKAWHEFLNLPETQLRSNQINYNTASAIDHTKWIQEYENLRGFFTEIRAFLHEKDRFIQRGNISGAQSSKFQARKGLKMAKEALDTLETALNQDLPHNSVSAGEVNRRKDLLLNMKDELKRLEDLVHQTKPNMNEESSARKELLQARPERPKSLRTFGVAPLETEKTRILDNQGILTLQQEQLKQQDSHIESLSLIIKRQREIGIAISNELENQNAMLGQLNDQVDRVDESISTADKKMKRILN